MSEDPNNNLVKRDLVKAKDERKNRAIQVINKGKEAKQVADDEIYNGRRHHIGDMKNEFIDTDQKYARIDRSNLIKKKTAKYHPSQQLSEGLLAKLKKRKEDKEWKKQKKEIDDVFNSKPSEIHSGIINMKLERETKELEEKNKKDQAHLEDILKKCNIKENVSDYELYQLLEANGYNPSKENLYVLKEGLINGDIELLDESRRLDREATKKVLNSKTPIHSHTYDVSGVLASFHKHQLGANAAKEGTPEAIEFAKEYGKFDKKQADEAIEAEQNTKEVSPERLARQLKIKKKVKDQEWRNEFNEYRDNDNPEITFKRANKQIFR